MATAVVDEGSTTRPGRLRHPDRACYLALAVLAFVVRLAPLLRGGGLGFYGRYDDGVYYTAADALSFGRIPYRQFVMLHPPGIMLVLLPFAAIGRMTTDLTGWEIARLSFMAVGALSTVLVASLARRWNRPAMWVSGVMYACWLPAIYAEQSTFLEPIGGLLVLVALWLLVRTDRLPTIRAEWIAGISLGLAETMKIWYVAPWATIVIWQLVARRWSSAARLVAGGAAALAVVVTPFAIASRGRLFDFVVRDQLLRSPARSNRFGRITEMIGVNPLTKSHSPVELVVATLLIVALLACIAACLRDRRARPLVAVMAVNAVVLMAGPVFFRHYESFIAAPTALVVGIGVGRAYRTARIRRLAPVAVATLTAVFLVSGVTSALTGTGRAFPARTIKSAAPAGCLAADDPAALIELDRLSSDFRRRCQVDVDVSGATYDWLDQDGAAGVRVPRSKNGAWQRYLYHYLSSANGFVITRAYGDGLGPAGLRRYQGDRILRQTPTVMLRQGTGRDPGPGVLPR